MIQYQNEIIEGKYYFIIEMGKSHILRKEILGHLQNHRPGWTETRSVEDSNVILVLCPIVSRAGTDIDAALNELNTCPASKPAIFMVCHHTFDPEKTVPDSSRFIIRRNTLTVDCLFHEDKGLLTCKMNDEALTKVVRHFKPQEQMKLPHFIIKFIFPGFIFYAFYKLLQESCLDILMMCIKCLYHKCCWILGIMKAEICNCIRRRGRGTCKSSTDDERSRLINEDEGKNVYKVRMKI